MKATLQAYVRKGLFYKSVVDDGSDIIFIVDYDGNILYHNRSVSKTLGYTTTLVGKKIFDYLPLSLLDNYKKQFSDCTRKTYNKGIEFQFLCKDKSYKHLEFNSVNLRKKEGIKGLILDCRDITQRNRDAEELLRAQKAKEQFLANISHEIRTPINGIAGMAALLSQNPSHEEQKTYLNAIKSAADNLKVIINDILDLASIESGKLKLEKIGFNLNDLLHSLIDTFSMQVREKQVKLTYTLSADANKTFIGDPVRLNQILINLIGNAVKFTHVGSISIHVQAQKVKPDFYKLRFDISDTGIGIPHDKLQTIFESFSQADVSVTRKYGGTGLGLTIVKQLVELQHGEIFVTSKENVGSTFTVYLPYKVGKTAKAAEAHHYQPKGKDPLKYHSVLLVEDNDINRLYASSILKMWGCHFETAENGVVALEKIRNHSFDAILMDIQMPVMDGFETTKAIRQGDPKKRDVLIIALTANATPQDFQKCLDAGMNDCIVKPFTQEDLFTALNKHLAHKNTPRKKEEKTGAAPATLVDLTYLKKISNNNQEFIKEIVQTFLESMPQSIKEIQTNSQAGNWEQVGKVVHKIKPTITLMGIHSLKDKIVLFEQEVKGNPGSAQVNSLSEEITKALNQTVDSLRGEVNFG
ncbi:MAG: response regulator [Cyclobacteriaceae bacterium]|nr:response regulator [Cyclobacteriaceae bacterium]